MHHPLSGGIPRGMAYTGEASSERSNFFRFQVYEKQERSEKVGIKK